MGSSPAAGHSPVHVARPAPRVRAAADRLPTTAIPAIAGNQAMQALLRGGWLRPKLELGAVDDPEEREADAVADRVMRTPEGACCASCGAGESCEDQTVRRKPEAAGSTQPALPRGMERQFRRLTTGGEPLAPSLRAFFEPRFGRDLGDVRMHAGGAAQAAAQTIQAKAFTLGPHIGFAAGRFEPDSPQGRRLLAHELAHVVQQRSAGHRVQRQPAEPAETEMPAEWAFAFDQRKRNDRRYARSLAVADAARIRNAGILSPQDREEVRAKLDFFEGDAWQIYSQMIRPALVEVTREEIQMPGDEPIGAASHAAKPKIQPFDITNLFNTLREYPEYIDNNIKMINYFTAKRAIIRYKDGTTFDLGLVPQYMKPPVVEIDYGTPVEQFRKFEDATTGKFGFIIESEMANAPRSMPYRDLLKTYARYVDFYVEPGTGRIVPSRINMLTAPTLCGLLLQSWRSYLEQVDLGVRVGLGGTIAIGGYAGAGGLPKHVGVALGRATTTRLALSPTAKILAREMDSLLAKGGTKTVTVEGVRLVDVAVSRQGNTLAVRRFMSELPEALRGQGTGTRVIAAFEDAAAEVGRWHGAKTVTIDVGLIRNPSWGRLLEARGYVRTEVKLPSPREAWVKTIKPSESE